MNLKKSNREGTGKKHNCLYCNKLIPLYKKYCNKNCYNSDKNIIIICKECGNNKKVPKNKSNTIYCSKQCANKNIDRKQTRIKACETLKSKYNVSNPFEIKGYNNLNIDVKKRTQNIKNTYNKKTLEDKKLIGDKISKTYKNKTINEKQEIRKKTENTNLKLYGVKNTLEKNSPFRKKAEQNNKEIFLKTLNQWLNKHNLELLDKYEGVKTPEGEIKYYNFKHTPSNTIFIDHVACGRMPIYKDPTSTIGISEIEKEFQKFFTDNFNKEIIFNNRKLVKGFEIDVYIPLLNLAFEFNGLYWHSELNGKNKDYHLYKTNECLKQNIKLIHIFEDEWLYKKDIVKSKILNLINQTPYKIYARKCIIKEVNNNDKNQFLNKTHIQGTDRSLIKYGLYYKEELVSILTFGNLRKITNNKAEKDVYELIRFSTKLNTNVIGGFSKLLKHFIKTHKPKKIISYADKRFSIGDLYLINNFSYINDTPPNYWYMKYYKNRQHRFAYRKSELSKKLEIFDPLLSEWENMKLNKFDRIWDCGSIKFELIY